MSSRPIHFVLNGMTTEQKGEIAQLKVQLRAAEKGFLISRPTIQCRYDAIVDDGRGMHRVQIKYGNIKSVHAKGAIRVDLRKRHLRHYTEKEIDWLLVYVPETDSVLLFTASDFSEKSSLDVRLSAPKNNQVTGVRLAKNFVW